MLSKLSGYSGYLLFSSTALLKIMITRSRLNFARSSIANSSSSISSSSSVGSDGSHNTSEIASNNKKNSDGVANRKSDGKDCACTRRSLSNTVKSYQRHLIICGYEDPSSWSSVIEDDEGSFSQQLGRAIKDMKLKNVKMSGCTRRNTFQEKTDVILYPDNVIYHLESAQINKFVEQVLNNQPSSPNPELSNSPTSWNKLILICVHGNRDRRCGVQGLETFNELSVLTGSSSTSKRPVQVYGSTHLGGHEFAGTCVVYPESHWYGYLSKVETEPFLRAIEKGDVVQDLYRGKGFA